jgi:hypothetical protein
VIAEVPQFHAVDPAVNGNFCRCVAELAAPFHEVVFLGLSQVVANLVHWPIIVYKRKISSETGQI